MMETEIYKLDRIEDGIAAIEKPDGDFIDIDASSLPENAKSGDCFTFEDGFFNPVKEETEKRRSLISSLLDEMVTKK